MARSLVRDVLDGGLLLPLLGLCLLLLLLLLLLAGVLELWCRCCELLLLLCSVSLRSLSVACVRLGSASCCARLLCFWSAAASLLLRVLCLLHWWRRCEQRLLRLALSPSVLRPQSLADPLESGGEGGGRG